MPILESLLAEPEILFDIRATRLLPDRLQHELIKFARLIIS